MENPIVEKLFELDDAVSNYFAPVSIGSLVLEEAKDKKAMPTQP